MSHVSLAGMATGKHEAPPTFEDCQACLALLFEQLENLCCDGIISEELYEGMGRLLSRASPRAEEGSVSLEDAIFERDAYISHYRREREYAREADAKIRVLEEEQQKLCDAIQRLQEEVRESAIRETALRALELEVRLREEHSFELPNLDVGI